MSPKTREPHRGEGVPRETPDRNSLPELERAITAGNVPGKWRNLLTTIIDAGYFNASMHGQFDLIVEICLSRTGSPDALLEALAVSADERIRGVAPLVASAAFPGDLPAVLQRIHQTACLDGTWPREMSCGVLHRRFVEHGVDTVLPLVRSWTSESHEGARRVVTEAIRPRLMMAPHIVELKQDPSPLEALLGPLIEDPSRYVRNSVANCLNDVSKDNPETLVSWVRGWWRRDLSPNGTWVLNRALRTLLSESHPGAMEVAGYADPGKLNVKWKTSAGKQVVLNELIGVEVTAESVESKEARVLIQLRIEEPSKGDRTRRSVYQIGSGVLTAGKTRTFRKSIHFTDKTRQQKLPGRYEATIEVNGRRCGTFSFQFERPADNSGGDVQ